MSNLEFNGRTLSVDEGESVLDCLLRNGEEISFSCKSGVCQSCVMRASAGLVPERAQAGLKDSLRAQGFFLACSCYPVADLTLASAGNDQRIAARITALDLLSDSVIRVRMQADVPLAYRAGQYISLFREDGLARSYSLASLPGETHLELQVRLVRDGKMSGWLRDHARPETPVWLQGPAGNCFYVDGNPEQPLLLAGTGTGLAPLYGIARDALQQGHAGDVWLFHGALSREGLYLMHELRSLAAQYRNFHYVPTVLNGDAPEGGQTGALDACVKSRFSNLEGWRGFVCGDPAFVNPFRKKIFLTGMASREIYADAFLPSKTA